MENIFETGQVLLIDKPYTWTSAMAVRKVRDLVDAKVGHAGTLDPLATGLLILCTGKFTRKINDYMSQEKEYTGSFTLGATTPTYDLEQEPEHFRDSGFVTQEILDATALKFTGEIEQVPPVYSAIKKNGKRAYELARQGIAQTLDARRITIRSFEMDGRELPLVHFRVICSTGTYIRSLAQDTGESLGCGAYLSRLCRTRIGNFRLEDALNMDGIETALEQIRQKG
jgi:tRNA pseudouridine55 synthase